MSSGLDWERFGVITGEDEVCILPPPTLSEKGVGIPTCVHFPFFFIVFFFLNFNFELCACLLFAVCDKWVDFRGGDAVQQCNALLMFHV